MSPPAPDSAAATDDLWREWARRRPAPAVAHLDSAAAGRSSFATLQATAEHALAEARLGAYIAAERAQETLAAGRAALAGLLGVPADGVAFVESASEALAKLLAVWPLHDGATVGVVDTEWGPNLETFTARGLGLVPLPADGDGRLDLDALDRLLASAPPTIVHLTHVTSHRGLVQPLAAAAALCRDHGVPLWVDAAQALGHVDADCGADALYATSRKWLGGPRGIGVLAVAEQCWPMLAVRRSAMQADDLPTVRVLESSEAHVAGRLGLAEAVRGYIETGPPQVWQRLDELGRLTRETIAGTPGWRVVDPPDAGGVIVALRPTDGQDVTATRRRLLDEHGIVTTACLPARAPRDMEVPLLRISPHVDCTPDMLERLRTALTPN